MRCPSLRPTSPPVHAVPLRVPSRPSLLQTAPPSRLPRGQGETEGRGIRRARGPTIRCSIVTALLLVVPIGCAAPPRETPGSTPASLRDRASRCIKAAVAYTANPAVRVEGIEALQSLRSTDALPWLRTGLADEVPAVRFAACVALGVLRDADSLDLLRARRFDPDASVRLAAVFALHRLGSTEDSGRLADALLGNADIPVRRNAALLLGLTGETGAVKVLAKAMRDTDPGVRQHALEAMARLGNREASQELVFMTNSGAGTDETFAIGALETTGDRRYLDAFRYKLVNGPHLETRLAAARALGRLGEEAGLGLAIRSLRDGPAPSRDPNDPPEEQSLRIRQLACAALGAIGNPDALAVLEETLTQSPDPRLQVSAAKAILEIVHTRRAATAASAADR